MPQTLDIEIKTLTPLWTGGIDGSCDQLHISGLMGSLRYWYEAIVRGVGGYACDPSNGGGCIYNDKEKTKSICAACYLFGTTGWSRLFRLTAVVNGSPDVVKAEEPLHFRTLNNMNANWLKTIYEGKDGERQKRAEISSQHMVFPQQPVCLRFIWRGVDVRYATGQIQMLFWFLSTYAGLGAKQQFGFGQIKVESPHLSVGHWETGVQEYKRRQSEWLFQGRKGSPLPPPQSAFGGNDVLPPNLEHFFAVSCIAYGSSIGRRITIGNTPSSMVNRTPALVPPYLSSAFDIRYKGDERTIIGFRRQLDGKNPLGLKWSHSAINAFLGASRQRGEPEMRDGERSASRLFVSMPYQVDGSENFVVRMYGFALPALTVPGGKLTPEKANELCISYLAAMTGTSHHTVTGADLLKGVQP